MVIHSFQQYYSIAGFDISRPSWMTKFKCACLEDGSASRALSVRGCFVHAECYLPADLGSFTDTMEDYLSKTLWMEEILHQ